MPSGWGRLLPAAAGASCLAVAIAACSRESPVAPATATGACAYVVGPTTEGISTVGGTFQVFVTTTPASGCQWTVSTLEAWMHLVGATSGQGTGIATIAVDGAATTRQGTVTVSWARGSQSIAVTQSCDVTQTLNLPAEGQQFTVSAPAVGCSLPVSSVSVDVPWIAVSGFTGDPTHPPPPGVPNSVAGVAAVNTGPQRIGHLTTPLGQVTVIQSAGNCVTAIAPTSQAFDENGGAGSFSVTAVPGCAWDATAHTAEGLTPLDITPTTAHGTGSGVVQFTIAANSDTFARERYYLVGGSLKFPITQSKCPLTVSPLSLHVPAAAAEYLVAVRVTGAVSCFWAAGSTAFNFITIANPGIMRGSGDARLNITQNQTGKTRSGTAGVADQTVVVTQDP